MIGKRRREQQSGNEERARQLTRQRHRRRLRTKVNGATVETAYKAQLNWVGAVGEGRNFVTVGHAGKRSRVLSKENLI